MLPVWKNTSSLKPNWWQSVPDLTSLCYKQQSAQQLTNTGTHIKSKLCSQAEKLNVKMKVQTEFKEVNDGILVPCTKGGQYRTD